MIKFNFDKDPDVMFKKNKMLYVISKDLKTRINFCLDRVDKSRFRKVLIVCEKENMKSIAKELYERKVKYDFKLINFSSLHKLNDKSSFKEYSTKLSLKQYTTKLSVEDKYFVVFKKWFINPDIILVDNAFRLGSFPKPNKAAQELKENINGIPVILSGYNITGNGKEVKLFHQLYAVNRTKHKNFYRFADEHVNKRDLSTIYNLTTVYDELNHSGKKWYRNIIDEICVNIDKKSYKDNFIIHTVDINEDILSMIHSLHTTNQFTCNGKRLIASKPEDKYKWTIQMLSGTLKIGEEYFILDESKAKFIKENYANKKLLIIHRFKSEGKILKKYFKDYNNITIDGYVRELNPIKYDYIIFYTLNESVNKMQKILAMYDKVPKVFLFAKGSMAEPNIFNKMNMQLNSL